MEFIAFDFETATQSPASACSLAVVRFTEDGAQETVAHLFPPPEMKFDDDNIRIHQIRPADVADLPTLAAIWEDFAPYFDGTFCVAHNAKFDTEVLRASLSYYGLTLPSFQYGDTVMLARRVWPDLPSYALNRVGNFLGLTFHHHRADEDALICGEIVRHALQARDRADAFAMFQELGLGPHTFLGEAGWSQDALF
ncbi:3'-5' exonuclease [Negativicoccus succinicivorans]|uniref:3'-5' exonuclease n=1 Tax=Negativicoccus succinicivorans TaxID=620903 RepID=UPI0028FE9808|nr:3'-5' exonuclease [Negativicoccus succinicivorans]MDU2418116.1 3'-5' exonuclease [Negativicoccus succinicivorans]